MWYRSNAAPELAKQRTELANNPEADRQHQAGHIAVPILRDLAKARETRIQHRGNYLDKGDVVTAGTPSVFPAPEGKLNRLTMAKWLISENNPLTARVIANRYWESLFGRGIVLTSEEFGSQGELPSHPELLEMARNRIGSNRLGHASVAEDNCDVSDLPTVGTRPRQRGRSRSRQPLACARSKSSTHGRDGARPGVVRRRVA